MFMEKQIADLIHEYAKSNRPPNGRFFGTIVNLLVEYWKLQKYVKKIESNIKEEDVPPILYNPYTKIITLNHYSLEDKNPEVNFYNEMFSGEEALAYYHANMVQNLLHTIEHVKQIQLCASGKTDSIEDRLTQMCGKEYTARHLFNIKYGSNIECDYIFRNKTDLRGLEAEHEFYYFDPMERLANIKSRELMVKILTHLKDEYPRLLEFEQASFIESLIEAYPESWDSGDGICPTQVYFNGIGLPDLWWKLGFSVNNFLEDFDIAMASFPGADGLNTRLRCGLPIAYAEYIGYLDISESYEKYVYTKNKNKSSK